MRSRLLAMLALALAIPVAHADNFSLFSFYIEEQEQDQTSFLLPTSPSPILFPNGDSFRLSGVTLTHDDLETGIITTGVNDLSFRPAYNFPCDCSAGGFTIWQTGTQNILLDLEFGYYTDSSSSLFTGTIYDPTFKVGNFVLLGDPGMFAFVTLTAQNTPVPEPQSFTLLSSALLPLLALVSRGRLRRRQ